MVSETPAHWYPDHPGYPLHLALTRLRAAVAIARVAVEDGGADDPDRVLARALWMLAMEADAYGQTAADNPMEAV